MKRKLAMLMMMTMTLMSVVSGCGKAESSKDTVTILYPGEEGERMSEFLDNEFAAKIKEDLGLTIEMVYVPWEQYWEQKDIMLAANEPIDLYWDGLADLSTMVNKKQCTVLNDLIDQYGQDMLKVLPEEQIKGGTIDGNIYGIPSAYAPSSAMFQMVCARKDLMENPHKLLAFNEKEMEQAKDINAPKQKKGLFQKVGESFRFLKNYYKQKREFEDYKENRITNATFLEILSTIDEYLKNRLKTV